mgnify:CR=1 FL=1
MDFCDIVYVSFIFYVFINTIGFSILGSIRNKAESKKSQISEVIKYFNEQGYSFARANKDIDDLIFVFIYHMILSQSNNINFNFMREDDPDDDNKRLYMDIINELLVLYKNSNGGTIDEINDDVYKQLAPKNKDSSNTKQQLLISIIDMIKNDVPFYNQIDLFNGKKKKSYGFVMFIALLALPPITMYIAKTNTDVNSVKYLYLFSFVVFPIIYHMYIMMTIPIYKIITCGSKMYSIGYHALFTGFFGLWIWFWASQGWGNRELGNYSTCGIKNNLVKKNFSNQDVNNFFDATLLSILFFGGSYSIYCGMEINKDKPLNISG